MSFVLYSFSLLLLLSPSPSPAPAQQATGGAMPLEAHERLWSQPGPEQSGPGAPRLLIVYPLATAAPDNFKVGRYAGRVEPENTSVTLNGQPLAIYPGGVFTGTRPLGDAAAESWRFEAVKDGKKTVVERILRRPPPPQPAPAWPLTFATPPVSPAGDAWLKPGDAIKITLYASPGHRAQVRIGGEAWKTMKEGPRDPDRGGVYTLELPAPRPRARPRLDPVAFRLSGRHEGERQSLELTSRLRVATIPDGRQLWARVTANLATFLKNGAAGDWERWGNWIRGTPFPVLDGHGGRLHTGFGKGEAGWIEDESAAVDKTFRRRRVLPALGVPQLTLNRQTLALAWPAVKAPVAAVYYPAVEGEGAVLRISLPGAASLKNFMEVFREEAGQGPFAADGFISIAGTDAGATDAPTLTVRLARPLWGYAMTCTPEEGLRLLVRTRPVLNAAAGQPLAGLRVMLDAGHGGASFGACGPSGLLEKDINLVQAAWLQKDLEALGAEVRQTRTGDVDVGLDERVDLALAWPSDLFISLHHNSVAVGKDPLSDSGPNVFYHYLQSEPLASAVAEVMARRLDRAHGPRARASIFRVNRNVSLCPSVLVESAYICNPYDEFKLRRTDTLKASAQAIAAGVVKLF